VKIRHLRKTGDFSYVLAGGEKRRGKTVSLHARYGEPTAPGPLEVGVMVTKKAAPKATLRNYIRRGIYAFFRDFKGAYKPGVKLVVRVVRNIKKEDKRKASKEIREEIERLSGLLGLVEK
jgi:ribonuclease P protein component